MDTDLQEEDLDQRHRFDNPKVSKNGKPRPTIVKFARYALCNILYKNKKKLKSKNSLITENLTTAVAGLLKEAQGKFEVKNILITVGRILYKENNRVFIYKK